MNFNCLIICLAVTAANFGQSYGLQARSRQRATGGRADDKGCSKREFDRRMSNVFGQFGPEDYSFPKTREDLKEYCRHDARELSKKYSDDCLEGTSQTLLTLGNYNFDKVNKQYCSKSGKKKDAFVSWGSCGNSARPKLGVCWTKMISVLAVANKVRNDKSKVPIVCCNYYEWVRCTVSALKEKASTTCSKEAIDGYESHIRKSTVESMNLICSKYEDDSAKCASLMTELPNTKPKKLYKTPYLYIFEIFKNL
ncbi:unnamed protein product [Oppiella nova]|uniref:Uncharacterized protein n=1 Tax=Oppiella nova TaxID=334625 RepID=A0A7R9LU28_9ACAR|nr:unnamed protein product [Oppiella nova]CAG2166997.1 unnamed protein product [Oppiella nova]